MSVCGVCVRTFDLPSCLFHLIIFGGAGGQTKEYCEPSKTGMFSVVVNTCDSAYFYQTTTATASNRSWPKCKSNCMCSKHKGVYLFSQRSSRFLNDDTLRDDYTFSDVNYHKTSSVDGWGIVTRETAHI